VTPSTNPRIAGIAQQACPLTARRADKISSGSFQLPMTAAGHDTLAAVDVSALSGIIGTLSAFNRKKCPPSSESARHVLFRCQVRKRSDEKEDNPICSDHQIEMAILIAMVLMVIDLKISECWSRGHNSDELPAGDCDLFA
jgi:hypothetical protein